MPKVIHNVSQRIMDAALKIYHEEGAEHISMRRVAKECGLAVGTVYNRFEDKQDLLAQMLAGDIEHIKMMMMDTVFGKDPEQAMCDLIYMFVENMMSETSNIVKYMMAEKTRTDYMEQILYGASAQIRQMVEELLNRVYIKYGRQLTAEESLLLAEMALSLMQTAAHTEAGDVDMRSDMVCSLLLGYAKSGEIPHSADDSQGPVHAAQT